MTIAGQWESKLVEKATISPVHRRSQHLLAGDEDALARAYQRCTEITFEHSKTFYLTAGLLDGNARKAARALYAFCRVSDNIADEESGNRLAKLQAWRKHSLSDHAALGAGDVREAGSGYRALGTASDRALGTAFGVAQAWADARSRFAIPREYAEQLLDGVAEDLNKNRYASFDELAHYSYGVASTVGLMTMHIVGYASPAAIPYAIKLGVALQCTNILRDVGEDWRMGRVYLPQDELAAFGLSDKNIAAGKVTGNWRAFMRFQIERVRNLYAEAVPGIGLLGRQGRFAIMASANLYRDILSEIEKNDYDVFSQRAGLSAGAKLLRLPAIWWRAMFV